jgi:hypothetical protein
MRVSWKNMGIRIDPVEASLRRVNDISLSLGLQDRSARAATLDANDHVSHL